ncbi:MAG: hypothetical protein NT099_04045 [Candidatus Saganbacteria bacterium]|nr:hypothetical protein [Candidatus Saganbacteria bacterium]
MKTFGPTGGPDLQAMGRHTPRFLSLTIEGNPGVFRVERTKRLPDGITIYYLRGNSFGKWGMADLCVYVFLDGIEKSINDDILPAFTRVNPVDLNNPHRPKELDLRDALYAQQFLKGDRYCKRPTIRRIMIDYVISHELEHLSKPRFENPAEEFAVSLSLLNRGPYFYLALSDLNSAIVTHASAPKTATALRILTELTLEPSLIASWEGNLTMDTIIATLRMVGTRMIQRKKPLSINPRELLHRLSREF